MPYRKLGRTSSHRWAMLRNMVTSLVEHERIRTTTAKAKELRRVADRMVTWAKDGSLHARRQAAMVIRTPEHLKKLFDVLGPRYLARAGGYTRILKLQRWRPGDAADMSLIEFVARPGELRPARPPQPPAAAPATVASSLQALAANSSKAKVSAPSSSSSRRHYSTSIHPYHCSSCTLITTGPPLNRIGNQQHHVAPAAAAGPGGRGAGEQPMPKETMTGTKKLSVLVLCTFCTLLAALEYHRGGATTQSVLQWGSDRLLLLGGGGGEDKEAEGAAGRLLMIGGGGEAAPQEGMPGNDRALIPTPDPRKRRRRTFLLDAGKAAMQVIQLPLKTVMFGLRKLFSLGRGGGKKGGKKGQHPQQSSLATKRGVLDMASLTEEELLWVEEVYQPLLAMPGITERGLAVKMPIDRGCVARYFIAAQWKAALRGQPMLDQVLRTLKWREDERVAVLGPEDVLAQAWEGYLYVNGTDLMGRPIIYFRPAFQANKNPEKAIQYLVYTLERALDLSREEGGVEAYSFVIDCSGFSLSNMPPVKIIKQTFTLLHHHYPTRVGFIVFLYTGSAFQLLWKVLAPLVSPMTRNKILFVPSGEEKKKLLMRVEGGELDGRYGGEKEFVFRAHEYFGVSEEEAQRLYEMAGGKKGKK